MRNEATSEIENTALLQNAFKYLPAPVFIMDPLSMKFIEVNEGACNQTGYSKEELLNMGPSDLNPEFSIESLKHFLNTASQGETLKIETIHQVKNGNIIEVELSLSPLQLKNKQYVLGVVQEVKHTDHANSIVDKLSFFNRYKFIVENAQVGIWQVDENFITTFVNDYFVNILGFTREEMIGKYALDFVSEEEMEDAKIKAAERSKGIARQYEKVFYTKTGQKLWFFVQPTTIFNNEVYKGSIATLINITEAKENQRKVAAADNKFHALIENISDAIAIISKDGELKYLSPSSKKMGGYNESLVGNQMSLELVHPHDIEIFKDAFQKSLVTPAKTFKVSYRYKSNEGNYIWIEGELRNLLQHPDIEGIVINYRDITERKVAEEKLRESEARYKMAQSQGKLGHFEMDLSNSSLIWSDEVYNIFGVESDEAPSIEKFLTFVHPEDQQMVIDKTEKAIKELKGFDLKHRIILKDSKIKYVHAIGEIVYDAKVDHHKMVGMIQDITNQISIEQELQHTQESYKLAEVRANLGHWQWDLLTNEIVWSDHLYKIFEVPMETIITYDIFMSSVHSNDREIVHKIISESIEKGKNYTFIHKTVKKNGTIRYLKEDAQVIKDDEGQAIKYFGLTQDITDRVLAAEKIKTSEEKYRLLFDRNPVPMFMVEFGTLKFLQVNDAAIKLYGYSKEEFLNTDLKLLRLETENYLIDNQPKEFGRKKSLISIVKHRNKKGDILHIRRSAVNNTFNNKAVWLMGCIDVSYEMKYEQQLKKSQEQLGLIFNTTPYPMWLLKVEDNNNFRYIELNSAYSFHTGYNKADILGKLTDDADYFNTYPGFKNRYIQTLEERRTIHFSIEMALKSGVKIADVTILPIINETGDITQLLCSAIDITENKTYENELIEKNLQLRELTSHMHNVREEERTFIAREIHDELGQLLTAIKMDISWVKKHRLKDESILRLNDTIQLVDKTINTIRKISSELRPSILDDLGLPEALASHGNDFARRTGVAFDFKNDPEIKILSKDIATCLYRIFQEALTNIIRHSKATSVVVYLFKSEDFINLKIIDNGIGIKKEQKNKKIKSFGLLGMKERISMLNGEFNIKSKQGEGTELIIKIPLNKDSSK